MKNGIFGTGLSSARRRARIRSDGTGLNKLLAGLSARAGLLRATRRALSPASGIVWPSRRRSRALDRALATAIGGRRLMRKICAPPPMRSKASSAASTSKTFSARSSAISALVKSLALTPASFNWHPSGERGMFHVKQPRRPRIRACDVDKAASCAKTDRVRRAPDGAALRCHRGRRRPCRLRGRGRGGADGRADRAGDPRGCDRSARCPAIRRSAASARAIWSARSMRSTG